MHFVALRVQSYYFISVKPVCFALIFESGIYKYGLLSKHRTRYKNVLPFRAVQAIFRILKKFIETV